MPDSTDCRSCRIVSSVELGIGGLGQATEIGAGASAVVYRALQVDLDREVAVKVLSATDEAFVRRFHREAMTLGKLSLNPGIVTVHGTGVTDSGHPYLILELCESSVLDHLKTEGPFDPMTACRVGAQVADAVSDAHNNGVVHRDIKPGNLLRSQKGRYLITDFGIATVRGSTLGQTDSIGFTAGYVAPETLRGEEAGTPADVYALGATLFHMLAGYPPFVDQSGNSNLLALAQRVINDPVPDLRLHGVPDDVSRIVEAAMAKHPSDRPSAAQLRDQLQAVVQPDRPYPAPAVTPSAAGLGTAPQAPSPSPVHDQTAAFSPTEVGGMAPPPQPGPSGYRGADQTTAMAGFGGPTAGTPPQPPNNAAMADGQTYPAGGVVLESNTNAAIPPGQANYPLPPHSDDGPQPWKILMLGVLAGVVILAATIAIALNRSRNEDGVDATEAAPESPVTNDDASEGGADGDDSNGVANSLPDGSADPETETATVPNVVGITEGDARAQLIGGGFDVLVQERTSSTATPGSVVAQDPTANSEETLGSIVVIFVAVAPEIEAVTIPTLAGMTEQEAVDALGELGLKLGDPIREFSDVPDGEVIRSAPDAGTAVDAGSDVVLIVSRGLAPPTCAQLVDLAEAEATTLIEAAGLTAVITAEESETQPEGEVISCEVSETSVSLVVSDGPDICGVVTGMAVTEGTAALEAKGYTVTATGVLRPALPAGEIFACEKQGTTATISYAEGLPTECPAAVTGATVAEARTILEDVGFTDITAEQTESDTVPVGAVISCEVSGDAVTVQVSTGPEVQTGTLKVTFDTLVIEGDCAGEGLRPDLYGQIGVSYGGQPKTIWVNRARNQALTPNNQGILEFDETKNWNGAETGGDLTVTWDLKDVDRVGQDGDEDIIDDDVSAVTRTVQLTGADRKWRPASDNNDACTLRFELTIEWSNLSS